MFRVECCPLEYAADVDHVFEAVALADESIYPNGNGWLNETQSFLDALRCVHNEKAIAKPHD